MKRILVTIIAILVIEALFSSCSSESQNTGIGSSGISLSEFNQLSLGMADDEVESIIGGSGELISESQDETEDYIIYNRIYRFEGETNGYAELESTLKSYKDIYEMIGAHDKSWHRKLSAKTNYGLE